MKLLIVANWKCNPLTLAQAKNLFNSIKKGIKNLKNIETVICPPFVYLDSLKANGAQDCFWEQEGSFTGEISPLMLKSLGVKYVIIGHSERRKYQKETDEMINKKLKTALSAGLKTILCIDNISQIKKSLKGIENWKKKIGNLIIAYEPLFAIGTGKACSIEIAKKARKKINFKQVLYGGSIDSQNAVDYIKKAGFQGLLIGKASLKAKEFVKINKKLN